MSPMKMYRLLQVFISAVNEIIQGLHSETLDGDEASARTMDLIEKLQADIS